MRQPKKRLFGSLIKPSEVPIKMKIQKFTNSFTFHFKKKKKIVRDCNDSQNIGHKVTKSNKTGLSNDSSIADFFEFSTAIVRSSFLKQRMGTRLCLQLIWRCY